MRAIPLPTEADRHRLVRQEGEVVEGPGAVGVAPRATGRVEPRRPVVVMVTGADIATAQHLRIAASADVDVT